MTKGPTFPIMDNTTSVGQAGNVALPESFAPPVHRDGLDRAELRENP